MAAPVVPWITTGENVVAYGHPTLPDVANRVLRFIFTKCGIDVEALGFIGFEPIINVVAMGAVEGGATDCATAFQAAINYVLTVSAKGYTVYVPGGRWKIGANLTVPRDATQFNGSRFQLRLAPGARLEPTAAVTELISFNQAGSQESEARLVGGILDGTNASAACVGVGIHTQNVKLCGTTIKYFGGSGVKYFFDLAAPPICSGLKDLQCLFNGIGIYVPVSASGFYMSGCRVEGSSNEGVWLNDCAFVTLTGNVIENSGWVNKTKPNLRITARVYGTINGNYFEDTPQQEHSSVIVEAGANAPNGLTFIGNICVGYYFNALTGQPFTNSVGLDIAPGVGVVDGITVKGNYFVGFYTQVRNGTNSRGYDIGPDSHSDHSAPPAAWSGATAYALGVQVTSGGVIYMCIQAHTNQVPPNATYWVVATGVTRYANTSVWPGDIDDRNRYGSTTTKGYGRVKRRIAQIVYSASITPDAQLSEWFEIVANNGAAFTINAPTNPPPNTEEQELEFTIRNTSGGALGVITWNAAFHLAGAFTSPATGFNRSVRFRWRGTAWLEMSRTAADVAN